MGALALGHVRPGAEHVSLRQILSAANGGELSPRLEGRVDLDGIYDRGFAEMFNFVATVEGPAIKRSGTRYIRAAALTSSWLSRFVFNVTQAYVLEWLEGGVRFYTNGGRIETDPATPLEVAVPYTAAEAPRISAVQDYDRLYLAHGSHPPAALTRTGAETFAYAELSLRNGPFKDANTDRAVTVEVSAGSLAVGGTATLSASSAIFDAGHVGAAFMLEATDFSTIKAWEAGYDGIAIGDKRRSDGKAYVAASAGQTGAVQPTHSEGSEWDGTATGNDINGKPAGGVEWTYLHDKFGMGVIASVIDASTCTITVTRRLPDSLQTVATYKWSHAEFSAKEGWPHLVCIAFGRMIFFKGLDMIGSVSGDYGGGQVNFAPLTDGGLFTADMAFRRRLETSDPPLWVKVDKTAMIVGTPSGEILITPINPAEPVSGDNIQAAPNSSYGSAEVWPVDIGTAGLFVQRGGRKVREAEYTFERDRFVGVNLTIWARHITRSGVKQLAFQQEPEELLWGVRNDGVLFAHPHSPEQQVKGISRQALGAGTALSITAIPSEDGGRDELWALADLDGDRAVLQFADWWDEDRELDEAGQLAKLKAAFFVDFGVSYSGVAKTDFNDGLDHLIGREVWILADGGVCPVQTVQAANPKIRLPYAAAEVHIGIGYEARLTPMRPEVRGAPTLQGIRKRITRLMLRLIDAGGVFVREADGQINRLIDRPGSSKMNQPIPLFNGDTANKSVGGGYDYNGQNTIVSSDPLPCIVAAQIRQLEGEG